MPTTIGRPLHPWAAMVTRDHGQFKFILHNIIHKYHVVGSVHGSRNLSYQPAHRLLP